MRFYIHPLLAALLAVAAAAGWGFEALTVFILLISHELAHLVAAKGYDVDIERIDLYPFGGVARVTAIQSLDPAVHMLVALAGPFNNLLLAAAGYWAGTIFAIHPERLAFFLQVNGLLAAVNLVPALPLDGGRALQALLQGAVGLSRARTLLTASGYGAAGALVLAGAVSWAFSLHQPNLFILAASIFWAALRERRQKEEPYLRFIWRRPLELEQSKFLSVRTIAVPGSVTVRRVLGFLGPRKYYVIVVLDKSLQPLGRLSETDLAAAAAAGRLADKLAQILSEAVSRRGNG